MDGGTLAPAVAPGAPTAPAVARTSGTNTVGWVTPSWNPGPSVTGYELQHNSNSSGGYPDGSWNGVPGCETLDASTRSCAHSGLTAGDKYRYRVRARNALGHGTWSPESAEATVVALLPGRPPRGTLREVRRFRCGPPAGTPHPRPSRAQGGPRAALGHYRKAESSAPPDRRPSSAWELTRPPTGGGRRDPGEARTREKGRPQASPDGAPTPGKDWPDELRKGKKTPSPKGERV